MWGKISSEETGNSRFSRRRRRSRWLFFFFCAVVCALVIAILLGLSQSAVRISHVTIYGSDQSLASIAEAAMQGRSVLGIPHDSTFFIPESKIRSQILTAHPEVAAVSMFRNGFTGLSIKVDYRIPIARWCGLPFASSSPSSSDLTRDMNGIRECYLFDATGFIYATTTQANASSTQDVPETPFILFDNLKSSQSPVGNILKDTYALPRLFDFARNIQPLGSSVTTVIIRNDEVDLFLANGSRITYLLGDEQNALTALISARGSLPLQNGSIEYIDLRFPGKIYLKMVSQ